MKKFTTWVVRPGTGRAVPQATIRVKAHPSTEASPDAPIYSDYDGLSLINQPFLSTNAGVLSFYAPDGRYDIYMSIPDPVLGTISSVLSDVFIYDPIASVGASSAIEGSHFVTTRAEGLLPNEIVIPTFKGHPDTPPASPHAFSHEFETADLNWSAYNSDGNTAISLADGRLKLTQATTTRTEPCVGYKRAFTPDSEFTITALVRLGYDSGALSAVEMSGERPIWGLGIRSSTGDIASIGVRGGSQGISVFRADYDSTSLVSADGHQSLGSNACYVRVRKTATEYIFEWSHDGFGWVTVQKIAAASLFTGTAAEFGLFSYASFAAGGSVECYADFIRYKVGS